MSHIPKEECAVYLKVISANVIKVLFEALKDLLGDVNMAFTPDGVRILQMDQYKSLMVDLFLDKRKLNDYYCPQPREIGISIPGLYKLLKMMSNDQILTMYIHKSNLSDLELLFESNDSNIQTDEYTLGLMDLPNDEDLGFPEDEYNLDLKTGSSNFKNICQKIKAADTKQIKISYSRGDYIFSGQGQVAKNAQITIHTEHNPDDEDYDEYLKYEGIFDLEKLISFTKCSSITEDVQIYLGNDLPLICEYELACGILRLLLGLMEEL